MHIATPSIHVLDWLGTLWQARRSITTRVSHPSIHTLETLILSANHVQNVQRKNNLNGNGFWWSEYRQRSQHTYLLLPYTCTFCLIDVTPPLISLEWHHKKNTPSIHLFDWCGTSSDKPGVASLEEYTIHPSTPWNPSSCQQVVFKKSLWNNVKGNELWYNKRNQGP